MKYNIITDNGLVKVEGEPLMIHDRKCIYHYYAGYKKITDLLTGMTICSEYCRKKGVKEILIRVASDDKHIITKEVEDKAIREIEQFGQVYPVNKV